MLPTLKNVLLFIVVCGVAAASSLHPSGPGLKAGAGSGIYPMPAPLPPVPRMSMNLDLPPEERWEPVLKQMGVKKLRDMFMGVVDSLVPAVAVPLIKLVGDSIDELIPAPYAGEIKGIAKTLDIGYGEMTFMNMLYDFSAAWPACTSIVAQDSNGTIWHGRNLDYPATPDLRNITAIIDYQSEGKTIYTTTSFVGQVGVFTGMKPYKFTISIDQRNKGLILENLVEFLQALLTKEIVFTSFIIRDALEKENSFEDVVERVVGEKEVTPVYIIIGGTKPGEGAVVTRDRTHTVDVWRLDLQTNRWFLLETNYDHWVPPPEDDDRRDPGNEAMKKVGQEKINDHTMWDVLSVKPVLNEHTVYTALMSAANPGVYMTRARKT